MLYYIIGKIISGVQWKVLQAGYGLLQLTKEQLAEYVLADPVAKRRTLFLVLFLSVCYPLSQGQRGPEMNLKTGSSASLFPQ